MLLIIWLVVYLPLWKILELKSVGMMTFPTEWKVIKLYKIHVPNQPVYHWFACYKRDNVWWLKVACSKPWVIQSGVTLQTDPWNQSGDGYEPWLVVDHDGSISIWLCPKSIQIPQFCQLSSLFQWFNGHKLIEIRVQSQKSKKEHQ